MRLRESCRSDRAERASLLSRSRYAKVSYDALFKTAAIRSVLSGFVCSKSTHQFSFFFLNKKKQKSIGNQV